MAANSICDLSVKGFTKYGGIFMAKPLRKHGIYMASVFTGKKIKIKTSDSCPNILRI
jgi:hypothetical protein